MEADRAVLQWILQRGDNLDFTLPGSSVMLAKKCK
jgi:hypothetical protein